MRDRAHEIALSSEYDGYIYIYIKNGEYDVISEVNVNEMLAQELRKPMTKKFERRRMYAMFKYLSCVINVLTNILGLNLRQIKMLKHFLLVGIINEPKPTPNTLCVDQGKKFSNRLMQK